MFKGKEKKGPGLKISLLPTPSPSPQKEISSEMINLEDKYIIGERLGDESTFKNAYKATRGNREYVIFKFKDPQRGQKEIKTFSKIIQSTNCNSNVICPVEIGFYEGSISIVTEFIEGVTLDTLIELIEGEDFRGLTKRLNIDLPENPSRNDILLTFTETITIFRNLINSLLFIHNIWKFVHLDIKPDNIMISKNLKRVHIIDLGSGCFGGGEEDCEERNATEKYGAPENIASDLYVPSDYWSKNGNFEDWKKADIYSLGKVFSDLMDITKFCNNEQKLELNKLVYFMTDENYIRRPTSESISEILKEIEKIECENLIQNIGKSFFREKI